jgi:cytochrome c2
MKQPARVRVWSVLIGALLVNQAIAWAQTDPAKIAKGQAVYAEKKCSLCHLIRSHGGKVGPELTMVGAKRDAEWLRMFMKEPKAMVPKAKMLPFKGTDEELEAVVAYMASLK